MRFWVWVGYYFVCLCVMVCLLKLWVLGVGVFELLGVDGDFVLRWRLVLGVVLGLGWSGGVLFFGVVKVMFWGVLVFGWRCYSFEGDMM